MRRTIDGPAFMAELAVEVPRERLERLGDLTALRTRADGSFYRSNYLRGELLYALVAARRPGSVLEFGTGRGYGAAAMALAMEDHEIVGRVHTIDLLGDEAPIDWAFDDGSGPRVERWGRRAFWERHLDAAVRARIVTLSGRSPVAVARALARGTLPPVDLAFVDGGHDHATARHDLLAAARAGSDRLGILVDDHVDRPGYGVVRAVGELFSDVPLAIVPTAWDPAGPGGMAWIDLADHPTTRMRLARIWDRERSARRVRGALEGVTDVVRSALRGAVR